MVVPLSIGYGIEVIMGGGVPNLLGVGLGVGLIVALAVGVAVGLGGAGVGVGVGGSGVAVGVGLGATVGVGKVTAAVLRSITSDEWGSVSVTRVPRPKMTRLVSINSPAAFNSSCSCWTSARSGKLGSGRKPWMKSDVCKSRSKSKSTASESRFAFGFRIIIWPAWRRRDSPRTPLR